MRPYRKDSGPYGAKGGRATAPESTGNYHAGATVLMAIFSEEERQRISAALNSKGINRPCPACGRWDITIVDGYVRQDLYRSNTHDAGHTSVDVVRCVAIECKHCGYLTSHTLRGLGLDA
jgi:hypothetical protein